MGFKRDEANPHQKNQKKPNAGSTTKFLWNLLDKFRLSFISSLGFSLEFYGT